MSEVLYRKYRPKKFAEVVGQKTVKTILQNAVRLQKPAHAYLFCGPRGVGKTTLARITAKAVNCVNPLDGEPCTVCQNCAAVQEGRFLDLIEMDAASVTGVDNIRDIIEHVKFTPSVGKFKVFIIDEVHMLSRAAFNALLKTLEEPPAHAIFILATTEIHKVPATIISRSQRFDLGRVSMRDILEVFERISADANLTIAPEALKLVAQAADGSLRDGLSILDQVSSFSGERITLDEVEDILGIVRIASSQSFLDLLIAGDQRGAVKFVQDLSASGKDLVQWTRGLLEYLRLTMIVKTGAENLEDLGFAPDEAEKLRGQSSSLSGPRLIEFIKHILEAYRSAKQSPVAELPLLAAVMSLVPAGSPVENITPSPQSSPARVEEGRAVDLGTIIDRWAEVLNKIREYNHSLVSSLRLARIVRVENLDLVLVFPYGFHRDTVDARKNKIVVEQVLADIFGRPLRVKLFLEKDLGENNDLLAEAVKVLGNGDPNLRMTSE